MNAVKIFGPGSALARTMGSGYEFRPQQGAMAEAVDAALRSGGHLIVEAGTGVGKSLAYLVPFLLWAREQDRRVVVATYTKALQQQLVEKDLPLLRRIIGDFTYALCVGGENYLCLRRFDQVRMHDLFETAERDPLNRLFAWSTATKTGLRSELALEPPPGLWSKVCRQSDLCFGKDCAYHRDCYYLKAKAREQQVQLLIANHHLLFSDIATGGNVLPPYSAAVLDEAHQIEDVATGYLGVEISSGSVRYLFDCLQSQRTGRGLLSRLVIRDETVSGVRGMIDRLRMIAEQFFLNLHPFLRDEPTRRVRTPGIVPDLLSEPLLALRDALLDLSFERQEEEQEVKAFAARTQALAAAIRFNLSQEDGGFVYWAERENNRCRLVASPVDLAPALREQLFGRTDTVVLTSATLSSARSFAYIRGRLGLDTTAELILDSPFDYEQQAILYVAPGLSDQEAPDYREKFVEELKALLSITGGRTLVLFTSYRQMKSTADILRRDLPRLGVLCQGEMPPYRLVEQFKATPDAALLGTASFWQGIDIPGDALQCVVIAKLPFAVPDDPVVEARMERLNNPFREYQVPQATLLFRQGFGRLIRSKTDRGAVAVLDSRIMTKQYGRWFLKSLPPCRITDHRDDVRAFFDDLRRSP